MYLTKLHIFLLVISAIIAYRVISDKPVFIPGATFTVNGYELIKGKLK